MATRNRTPFLRQALRCFAARTHRDAELIVVDDSERSHAALCRPVPGVQYIRLREPTLTGTKLNIGIEAAQGDIIQKLDDDDYYAPGFLATQRAHFQPDAVLARCCFLILLAGDTVVRHSGHGWQPGSTLCFSRAVWKRRGFRELAQSEDSWFLRDRADLELVRICGHAEQHMVVRHGGNTWTMMTNGQTADECLGECAPHPRPLSELVPPLHLRFLRGRGSARGSRAGKR